MFCEDLDGWDGEVGGRFKRERAYVYIWLIQFVEEQKVTQHCKVIKLQKRERCLGVAPKIC